MNSALIGASKIYSIFITICVTVSTGCPYTSSWKLAIMDLILVLLMLIVLKSVTLTQSTIAMGDYIAS